jgi:hydroxyacylglutathione hydrolase
MYCHNFLIISQISVQPSENKALNKIYISGDVLFRGSIGRTDLPGGDFDTLIESVQTKLFPLGDEVVVYPGHGGSTTIGYEKKYNPFLT